MKINQVRVASAMAVEQAEEAVSEVSTTPADSLTSTPKNFVDAVGRRSATTKVGTTEIEGFNGARITLNRHSITVDGLRLNVMEAGPADGEVVVLLHGFPDDWHLWEKEIPHYLAAGKRVIVPDLIGAGESDKPTNTVRYHVPNIASDVLGMLDQMNVTRFAVKGHDWGGLVTYFLQERAPERIIGMSTNFGHPDVLQEVYSPLERAGVSLAMGPRMWHHFTFRTPVIGDWLTKKLVPTLISDHPDKAGVLERGRENGSIHPRMFEANSDWLFTPQKHAGRVTVPTQVMISQGDLKYIFREMATGTKHFVDAPFDYVELPSQTHWFPRDSGEQSAAHFLRFLDGVR